MAEIKPMALIESMKKKVCEHSDVYFRTNKRTGKVTTGKLCNPSDKQPSEAQVKAQARFKKVVTAVRALLADPEQKSKLEADYNAQNKYGSLFGYAMHKLNGNYDENGDPIELPKINDKTKNHQSHYHGSHCRTDGVGNRTGIHLL